MSPLPSSDALSTTTTSPRSSARARTSLAVSTQRSMVSASLRHGMTTDTDGVPWTSGTAGAAARVSRVVLIRPTGTVALRTSDGLHDQLVPDRTAGGSQQPRGGPRGRRKPASRQETRDAADLGVVVHRVAGHADLVEGRGAQLARGRRGIEAGDPIAALLDVRGRARAHSDSRDRTVGGLTHDHGPARDPGHLAQPGEGILEMVQPVLHVRHVD